MKDTERHAPNRAQRGELYHTAHAKTHAEPLCVPLVLPLAIIQRTWIRAPPNICSVSRSSLSSACTRPSTMSQKLEANRERSFSRSCPALAPLLMDPTESMGSPSSRSACSADWAMSETSARTCRWRTRDEREDGAAQGPIRARTGTHA